MSERRGKRAAVPLILACVLLCLVPFAASVPVRGEHYRNRPDRQWELSVIRPERNGRIRVNEADAEELTELNGIGETYAALIIAEREANGFFHYPEDLASVRGIGSRTVEKLRSMIDLTEDESGD